MSSNAAATSARELHADVNREYARLAGTYKRVAAEAAESDAEHKVKRAQAILRLKDSNPGMSHAEATTRAEADDLIADLHRDRLCKEALRDSLKEKLHQLKEQVQSARTDVVNERTGDQFHAQGWAGTS